MFGSVFTGGINAGPLVTDDEDAKGFVIPGRGNLKENGKTMEDDELKQVLLN